MIIEKTLLNYIASNGKEPFEEWLTNIKDKVIRARIRTRLDKLSLGHYGDVKAIEGGVFELRFSFGAGYRIYFGEVDKLIIVLLCGGDKSTQIKDIKRAKGYWQELIKRNNL